MFVFCLLVVVKEIAAGAEGFGFDSRARPMKHSVANAAPFLRRSVAQALSGGDGPSCS